MFSLQRILGKGDQFFPLLQAAAEEAHHSVQLLSKLTQTGPGALDEFVLTRRKEKKISERISEELVKTFVTPIEREDIEALSNALYKIPKSAEKFAERFCIAAAQLKGVDFTQQAGMMERASETVVAMVRQMRHLQDLESMKELNTRLQYIEGEADRLITELIRQVYSGQHDPLRALIIKDHFELMEKVVDRCRDAGNVVTHIVLKNS